MKIGFIGLGIMGESMSENIVKKHDDIVYVYDIAKEKTELLESKGASACKSAAELAEKADVIITMVPKSEHSMAVYKEILTSVNDEKICIDMSTIHPNVSIEIANMVKSSGGQFLDAPVVKSKPAAVAGQLGIYVGGDRETFESVKLILSYMGANIIYMGDNGRGLVMKICHNALVSQIQNGVNETLALAEGFGIDINDYVEAISYGGGQNFYLDGKAQAIRNEDFTTAFSVENMYKDINICMELAEQYNKNMPGQTAVKRIYDKAMQQNLGKMDFSATIKTVRKQMNCMITDDCKTAEKI